MYKPTKPNIPDILTNQKLVCGNENQIRALKKYERELEEWEEYSELEAKGMFDFICNECDGEGEYVCNCCGNYTECEHCIGTGIDSVVVRLHDYIKAKREFEKTHQNTYELLKCGVSIGRQTRDGEMISIYDYYRK